MNGWTATATMSSANGDGWGVIVGSNQTSHIRLFLGFYVSATDTVRLVANFNVSAAGEAADPTYTVTTGGNLDVEIRVDCDRPAASNGATVDYYIGGALAGSRVVSYTSSGYTYPAMSPYYTSSAADNSATHNFYKRNTTTISADLMTRWDNDAATVAGAYGNTFSTTWRGTDCFAVRPPVGGNPFVIRSGEEFIARAKAAAVSGSGITAYIYQTSRGLDTPAPTGAGVGLRRTLQHRQRIFWRPAPRRAPGRTSCTALMSRECFSTVPGSRLTGS